MSENTQTPQLEAIVERMEDLIGQAQTSAAIANSAANRAERAASEAATPIELAQASGPIQAGLESCFPDHHTDRSDSDRNGEPNACP